MPLVLINMGGEMIYILDQRLHAQMVAEDKSHKVIDDVVRTMFNPKFVAELFKPTEIYSPQSMRQVFDRLAHSSIMRLSEASMDKLYDLMMMGFKQQMLCVQHSEEVVFVALNHLTRIRELVVNEAVIAIVDNAITLVKERYGSFSQGDFCELRHILASFCQDKHIKVSLFLQGNIQASDGSFILGWGGYTPPYSDATPPGTIRYFGALGEETMRRTIPITCSENVLPPEPQTMDTITTVLGENMYLKDRQRGAAPPDREANSAGSAYQAAAAAAPPPPPVEKVTAKSAMAELNMLAELMGSIVEETQDGDDGFRLNLFNDTAIPDGFAQEVKAEHMKFDSNKSNQDLKDIASSMDFGGSACAGADDGDDLLDLMDAT